MAVTVQVDNERVTLGLNKLGLSLARKKELMEAIGASQLRSIYKTFEESGSPAASWMPLAPSTIRRNPKKYGPGHKLLIDSGRLRNSIRVVATENSAIVGTNLVYAAVHQFGSRDRGFGIGPRTEEQEGATVKMPARSYSRLSGELGYGKMAGHRHRIIGPRNARKINVRAHGRHQNIPPRPYLVFRPEDPERIRGMVETYVRTAATESGLEGAL